MTIMPETAECGASDRPVSPRLSLHIANLSWHQQNYWRSSNAAGISLAADRIRARKLISDNIARLH